MPLYEYQCRQCGATVEKIQKFADPPLTKCEKCGGSLERLLSSPAIQFKGSGWYITDYARKPATPASGTSAPAESKGDTPAPAAPAPDKAKPSSGTK